MCGGQANDEAGFCVPIDEKCPITRLLLMKNFLDGDRLDVEGEPVDIYITRN